MPALNLHAAIASVNGQLTAKLTVGACLAQLCQVAAVYQQHQPDVDVRTSYREQAASNGFMAALLDVLEQGIKVSSSVQSTHTNCLGFLMQHLYTVCAVRNVAYNV